MMFFTTDSLHAEGDAGKKKKQAVNGTKLKANEIKDGSNDKNLKKSRDSDREEDTMRSEKGGKKNKKRKRNQVTDLRFETTVDKLAAALNERSARKRSNNLIDASKESLGYMLLRPIGVAKNGVRDEWHLNYLQ
ncbi:Cytochrome P450 family protein [Hibiscus syriacus]|uniref:Cytochrome P450 family protein n=1 Tax=Hibiscus syriacus TaxID=106335 RepID=A0A6A3BZB6_HIBSY|nr:Cytochrome P450 family protein [Hibiscus syriacus]